MEILLALIGAISGIGVIGIIFVLLSPFFKDTLTFDPNNPNKFSIFVRVGNGRMVTIDFGGSFYYAIDGDVDGPVSSTGIWGAYRVYVWEITRLHPYFPYLTVPFTYNLPRYDVKEENGKRVYRMIDEKSPRYRTDHVRTAPFTWNFEFAGVEIQRIPFLIKGSAQVRIDKSKIREALYLTESWNVLLDQALASVTRSVARSETDLDMIIGRVEPELWKNAERGGDAYSLVTEAIMNRILTYRFDPSTTDTFSNKSLSDLGIIILKIDITDFEDELPETEKSKLRAGAIGRETGRGKALDQKGVAEGQRAIVEAHGDGGGASAEIIKADALVRASEAGQLGVLITALTESLRKK